jgi:hypothetical protein
VSAGLLDQHERFLADRAVALVVAAERGYSSTVLPGALREMGFSVAVSRLVPGLLIPLRDVQGNVRYHQYRPDKPRNRDGKPVKYETPAGTRLVLDVPPRVLARLGDPVPPLFVTEGPVKADAAVSAGWACIGMTGVWGWRGTNHRGGKTVLPDWDYVALNGRTVYLVPDSDVATNPAVAAAVSRLGVVLGSRDANVRYVYLPTGADGGKTGLDDWLAQHGPDMDGLLALASEDPPASPKPEPAPAPLPAAPSPAVAVPDDPAGLLHEVAGWLRSYVAFPSAHAAVAVTLWVAHTHLAACFDSTPSDGAAVPRKGMRQDQGA